LVKRFLETALLCEVETSLWRFVNNICSRHFTPNMKKRSTA
jgi:hypothetical protein